MPTPMPRPGTPRRRAPNWTERGSAAVDMGDLDAARLCFAEAVRSDRGNARHRYHLAVVEEGLGDLGAAAASLTAALRLDPGMTDAARRLSLLAGRCELPAGVPLDPAGLRAALAHDTVDRELIAETAMRQLAVHGPLGAALAEGQSQGWLAAARGLCLGKAAPLIRDALFLEVLRTSSFRGAEVEQLLTALRRVLLLELPLQRLEERALFDLALALAQQCRINEHVWAADADESERAAQLDVGASGLLGGDVAAARRLLVAALYRPLSALIGAQVGARQADGIRPRTLRDVVVRQLADAADERERMARLPRLGPAAEATARTLARHYEASPYPRWSSVGLLVPRDMRRALGRYFSAHELEFLERPFEVLIAGCGTGQQAVQAALAYGPQASVLAIDLSAPSLAYAARMAQRFGAGNITFAQADLQTLCECEARLARRFRVIECTGVLHHLSDPFGGWRALLRCLADDGLMLVGLYSAIARREVAALRADPAYPGPGCDDEALRRFRRMLLQRPAGVPGGDLKGSRDFYTASNFRDLALHVSEHPVALADIARFLAESGLAWRGFQLERGTFDRFREHFPAAVWPGGLERWATFEEAHPRTFSGMYNFWCKRC